MDAQLIDSIKTIAKNCIEESDPCTFLFGTVELAAPLKIRIDDKLVLDGSTLVIPRYLTDHEQEIEAEFDTETAGSPAHEHPVKLEKKKIKIKNALQSGEKVIMVRQQGGQKYMVLDRCEEE